MNTSKFFDEKTGRVQNFRTRPVLVQIEERGEQKTNGKKRKKSRLKKSTWYVAILRVLNVTGW
jgi:hypothetical protein